MTGTQQMIVWLTGIGAVTLMVLCYQILVWGPWGDHEDES